MTAPTADDPRTTTRDGDVRRAVVHLCPQPDAELCGLREQLGACLLGDVTEVHVHLGRLDVTLALVGTLRAAARQLQAGGGRLVLHSKDPATCSRLRVNGLGDLLSGQA